ncbi:MAG: thiamine phosphate synthase, partial [Bradyrhizobium sp.]|uniref:thiamine phosphate synthase n=1 Tax=Bradyrhizobium sp. TaxID=376 RepID=UPI001A321F84
MKKNKTFRLVLIKPSHYDDDGYVIRWWRGGLPSNSLACLYGIALDCRERGVLGPDCNIEIDAIDETNWKVRVADLARAIKAALAGSFVPLLINDRVDVALAAGADGVHVGWDDMPVADARRLLGREAIIGLSIKTRAQIDAAPIDLLDYVCIGGVFETSSKDNK